jgi:3-deoxy-manno-octulosonate cytidylyltransferase (CMP-KDO synthetase)
MIKVMKKIKVLAVIPARYGSTRLPGKPLSLIGDKTMIQWVYENVKKCELIDKVIVATDDIRIFNHVKHFGGEVIMTSKRHRSGSDRVAEVAKKILSEIVVNVQGDEPLISRSILYKTITECLKDKRLQVVTPICKIEYYSELFDTNFVKVVIDKNFYALYFSRSVIPFVRDEFVFNQQTFEIKDSEIIKKVNFYRHIGVYVFRRNFLFKFLSLPPGKLEQVEKLEQLRILEHGYKIKTVLVNESPINVDTEEDLKKVREVIKQRYESSRSKRYKNW